MICNYCGCRHAPYPKAGYRPNKNGILKPLSKAAEEAREKVFMSDEKIACKMCAY
jgi:hypothetical protein